VAEDTRVIEINDIKELAPTIYQVTVTREDGSTDILRMSRLDLNRLKTQMGLPIET
jgi:hypothetical protein